MDKKAIVDKNIWLEELFEFDYCSECHGDIEDHNVIIDILGNYFAKCKNNSKCHVENCEIH